MEHIGLIEDDTILLSTNENIIIFGAGQGGRKILQDLRNLGIGYKVQGFCDNDSNKWGQDIEKVKIYSEKQIKEIFHDPIIIIASVYDRHIYKQLKDNCYTHIHLPINIVQDKEEFKRIMLGSCWGWKKHVETEDKVDEYLKKVKAILEDELSRNTLVQIIKARQTGEWKNYLNIKQDPDKQYFDLDILKFGDFEVFVDLGAHIGDTIDSFIKKVNNKYAKIYGFEPSKHIFLALEEYVKKHNIKDIQLFNSGTWDKKEILNFTTDEKHLPSSAISKDGKEKIAVDKLDSILSNQRITFIKMDIEGSEKQTILGAREIIKKYKPKLAISVYHKQQDIYELPLLIKELVPEYKLYLRHYVYGPSETVLYATVD